MDKLFTDIETAYDPKNRAVYIAKDADGEFFVFKPRTGFKSRGFAASNDPALQEIFERQRHCSHNQASYLPGEAPGSVVAGRVASQSTPVAPVVDPNAPATGGDNQGSQSTPVVDPNAPPVTPNNNIGA
jgi:hypothetical protein